MGYGQPGSGDEGGGQLGPDRPGDTKVYRPGDLADANGWKHIPGESEQKRPDTVDKDAAEAKPSPWEGGAFVDPTPTGKYPVQRQEARPGFIPHSNPNSAMAAEARADIARMGGEQPADQSDVVDTGSWDEFNRQRAVEMAAWRAQALEQLKAAGEPITEAAITALASRLDREDHNKRVAASVEEEREKARKPSWRARVVGIFGGENSSDKKARDHSNPYGN